MAVLAYTDGEDEPLDRSGTTFSRTLWELLGLITAIS